MERSRWTRATRPILTLAVLGAVLGGCGGDARQSRYYGGGGGYYGGGGGYYGGPGYYNSPYYGGYGPYGGYDRSYRSRGYSGGSGGYAGRPPSPRMESPSQDRLGQFWRGETRPSPSQDRLGQFWRGEIRPPR